MKFVFKLLEPNKVFSITSKAPKYVMALFIIVISIGLLEALIFSPEDYKQSHSVRIMYVHVPAAWITLGIFTSMLILALFYLMYLLTWRIYENKDYVFKITTIITLIGIINVPIIKYSVEWWNTLHQPASINLLSKSSIHSSMLFPLLIMTAAFALFSLLIFLMKYNTELIKIKNKGLDRL